MRFGFTALIPSQIARAWGRSFLYMAPWGFTCCSGIPSAWQKAESAPIWYITMAFRSAGDTAIFLLPKPTRSGYPGWAPTAVPFFLKNVSSRMKKLYRLLVRSCGSAFPCLFPCAKRTAGFPAVLSYHDLRSVLIRIQFRCQISLLYWAMVLSEEK